MPWKVTSGLLQSQAQDRAATAMPASASQGRLRRRAGRCSLPNISTTITASAVTTMISSGRTASRLMASACEHPAWVSARLS